MSYTYHDCCINLDGQSINDMKDDFRELTREEFCAGATHDSE